MNVNYILKAAKKFEKIAQIKQSMQPADVENKLREAGLWGGPEGSFDPQSAVADKVFKVLDKYAPPQGSFKINTWINVPSSLQVTISVEAPSSKGQIAADLTRIFGPRMSAALKSLSKEKGLGAPPEPGLKIKWFNDVGY